MWYNLCNTNNNIDYDFTAKDIHVHIEPILFNFNVISLEILSFFWYLLTICNPTYDYF